MTHLQPAFLGYMEVSNGGYEGSRVLRNGCTEARAGARKKVALMTVLSAGSDPVWGRGHACLSQSYE